MKKNIKGLLLFIIFILPLFIPLSNTLSIPLPAQNYRDMGIPFIRNYTPEDYNADFENWGIVRDHRGVMYFANDTGVLEYDGKYWNFFKITDNVEVRSIAIDESGTIYVGGSSEFGYMTCDSQGKLTYISLLDKVKKEDRDFTDAWSTFTTRTQGTYYITPTKIFHWHNGTIRVIPIRMGPMDGGFIYDELFLTTEEKGICIIRGDTIIPLPHCEKIYPIKYGYTSILPYPDDRLLIVTGTGKFFLYDLKMLQDPRSKSLDLTKKDVPASILQPFYSEISGYVTRRHNILHRGRALSGNRFALTTVTGGIIIMDRGGRLLQVLNKARGLVDNAIWDVYEDENRNLWVAANTGLSYVETGSPITGFDYASGLTGYAGAVTRFNGKLFAFFDSTMPRNYHTPFNARIRKVTKGRDTVIFNGTHFNEHWRKGNQPQALIPTIEYKDNSLTFEFSAVYYEHEQENRFKYILEGFDNEWSDWTNQNKKEYTNLAEGQYRFRVRARNIYEHQSREAQFAFTVSPPWYRTTPAYIAWILSTGGFITGVVKLYLLRREAEKNLRESEEKFRVLAEKSVVGICILQDNAVKYANPRFHEIFRYAPGQMTGKNLLDWVKEEDRPLVTLNLEIQAADPLKSEAFEFRGISAAGHMIHLEGRGTQTLYKGKLAFLETIIDISERKKAEEELMQSKKLETVGILSGGIAHDFNNLLSIIMGNLSLVQNNFHQSGEGLEKYMKPMEVATFQAADLVKNFITLAAGFWIDFKKIALTDILKEIGDEAPQINEIPYTLSIPGDLKPIHGDERKLRLVMSNLLTNAYEAVIHQNKPGPAPIIISAQNINLDKNNPWNLQEGEYVKISISDTGKGIPPYHMDKIFDPYFTTKQRGARKGMGMGLAICNAIIKKHKGHITVSSEVDKGTVVDLFLPTSPNKVM